MTKIGIKTEPCKFLICMALFLFSGQWIVDSCGSLRLVLAIAEDWHRVVIATKFRVVASLFASSVFLNLCPHAGQAHTFLKLKKYAKKFCRKLRLPRQCKAKVESYQFLQLLLWAIMLH